MFSEQPNLPRMVYTAGQQVRVRTNGAIGKVFLKLPLRDVYLVQFPGFPVVEKVYNGSDLEAVSGDSIAPPTETSIHHHA